MTLERTLIGEVQARPRACPTENFFDFSLPDLRIAFLLLGILASLLGIIYIKDLNRRTYNNFQAQDARTEALTTYHNKLILEESALEAAPRIQELAEENLHMEIANGPNIVLLKDDLNQLNGKVLIAANK